MAEVCSVQDRGLPIRTAAHHISLCTRVTAAGSVRDGAALVPSGAMPIGMGDKLPAPQCILAQFGQNASAVFKRIKEVTVMAS